MGLIPGDWFLLSHPAFSFGDENADVHASRMNRVMAYGKT